MRCLVIVCVVCGLVLSAITLALPHRGSGVSMGISTSRAQGSGTELMRQSAYKKKMDRAKQERTADNQLAASVVPTPARGNYDYAALIILGASVVVLALIAVARRSIRLRL